jgi:hypothetical protein
MSFDHHHERRPLQMSEELTLKARLLDQMLGQSRREYPAGRMGAEDDGSLSYAIAADKIHGVVIIRFGKPVEWIGLGPADVEALRDNLTEKLAEIRGIRLEVMPSP